MAKELISAKATVKDENGKAVIDPETNKPKTIEGSSNYDFGETLQDLIQKCAGSEEVVRTQAIANIKVGIQSLMRTALLGGISPEGLQIKVESYIPGVAASKTIVDPLEAAAAAFETWSPEKQEEYLKQLGSRIGAAA